jgi:hypothetical protein
MNNQFTYHLMPHLPRPPQSLIDQIDFTHRPVVNDIGVMNKRTLTNWNGTYTGTATCNIRRKFNDEYLLWINDNITTDFQNAGLMYCWGSPDIPSTGAHTDVTRDYVLLYNLSTGGPDATLCFWKEKNHALVRDRGSAVGIFDSLELVDSIKGPENVWYLTNTRILHSTENVVGLRLNLQISFDTTVAKDLLS